jgi:hypothetical protein
MSDIVTIEASRTLPNVASILAAQGVPENRMNDPRSRRLAEEAQASYARLSVPVGLVADIAREEFGPLYAGEGHNAAQTPLDMMIPQSHVLALFAITLGEAVSAEISRLFGQNDFAGGAMLDAAASLGADLGAEEVERHCERQWRLSQRIESSTAVTRFSPGYCGWHVSGQRRLFERLKPERIGIQLNNSYLMQPLKSVSGVIVAAPQAAFDIDDTYPFCSDCTTHSCRDRFAAIVSKSQTDSYRN